MIGKLGELLLPAIVAGLTAAVTWLWRAALKWREDLLNKASECEQKREALLVRVQALETSLQVGAARWVRDRNGVVLSANPEFVRLFLGDAKLERDSLVGRKLADIEGFPAGALSQLEELDRRAMKHVSGQAIGVVMLPDGRSLAVWKFVRGSHSGDLIFLGFAAQRGA